MFLCWGVFGVEFIYTTKKVPRSNSVVRVAFVAQLHLLQLRIVTCQKRRIPLEVASAGASPHILTGNVHGANACALRWCLVRETYSTTIVLGHSYVTPSVDPTFELCKIDFWP
jgi:hypothetical protein